MFARALAALLLLPPAVSAPAPRDFPAYRVEAGTTLVRTLTSTTRLDSKPVRMYVDGEELPTEAQGEVRLRVTDDKEYEVADTITAVAAGRATRFEREYREFKNRSSEIVVAKPKDGDAVERESARERTTPLEGHTVRFTWDAGEEEYAPTFVVAEGAERPDASLLEGLAGDLEWIVLLEDGPREVGATFALEAAVFERVQYPLGDLHWLADGEPVERVGKEINEELSENLAGKAKATWRGVREEDGRQLGVFELEADLTSRAEAETDSGETRAVELELDYEGRVLWDMQAGRLAGYSFEADVRSVLSSTREVQGPQGKVALRQVFDLEGTAKHALTVRTGS
ncbi:MAG: hypothetical protein JNK02_06350 [Planctomycetes bacterium]|nr:hypothetical protein [Planctomycetota bacterium]